MERHSKIANIGFIMTDWNPFPRLYHILGVMLQKILSSLK
jgi:hypothetical protein